MYVSLCEDHNPITFEAYLGNIGSYNILHWHRSAVVAAGFIGMVNIRQYRQKYSMAAMTRQATICDHMWPNPAAQQKGLYVIDWCNEALSDW